MIYEVTIPITVKVTISEDERSEALAYSVERGMLDREERDRVLEFVEGNGVGGIESDVIYELSHSGSIDIRDAINDWLDTRDACDVASAASEVYAYKPDDE